MALDPTRKLAVIVKNTGLYSVDVSANPPAAPVAISASGDVPAGFSDWGIAYEPSRDLFVLWGGGRDIYTLDPATWAMVHYPNPVGPAVLPTANSDLVYSKWAYVPEADVFVGYNNYTQGVWLSSRSELARSDL